MLGSVVMLSKSNDSDLIKRKIDAQFIPFCQIWQELVSNRTLDTYQYRIFTSISILKELLGVLDKTIDGTFTNDANLDNCKEESLAIIKNDIVFDKYFKNIKGRLLSALGISSKSLSEKKRLQSQIKYLLRLFEQDYYFKAFAELEEAISNKDMSNISYFANIIASQAVNKGWSTRALFELIRLFTSDKTKEEQWSKFKNSVLLNGKNDFTVLIWIPLSRKSSEKQNLMLEMLGKMGLNAYSRDELVSQLHQIEDLRTLLKAEKKYFKIEIQAYDAYMAAHTALFSISDKLNLISFYNFVGSWDLASVGFVSIDNLSKYHTSFSASELYQTYDYLDSSGKIFADTQRIILDDSKKKIRDKLEGTFSYTNTSRCSLFQEEKYMNLWVALESLSRTQMYSDIISGVKNTVPAAETLRYIYRNVRNYADDVARCCVEITYKGKTINCKKEAKQELVNEIIQVLNDPESYALLLDRSKINSLLAYRTECIHKLVTDEEYAVDKISNHYNKVRWQIQRLYRIRNEITHTALREQTSLMVYIEHLYDYLSKYIAEIVTCINEKGYSTLEEALAYIVDNYNCFIELSKEKDKKTSLAQLFETGVISLL